MTIRIRSVALLALMLLPLVASWTQANEGAVGQFFREYVGLNNAQIVEIRAGKAVARILDSRTPDEVFVFGAVYVQSTPEDYLRLASDVDSLRKLPSYLAIQKFSDPPRISDLDGLTLEADDVQHLKTCKPGHCEVQLPSDAMEAFHRSVDWSAPDAAEQVNRLAKRMVL